MDIQTWIERWLESLELTPHQAVNVTNALQRTTPSVRFTWDVNILNDDAKRGLQHDAIDMAIKYMDENFPFNTRVIFTLKHYWGN